MNLITASHNQLTVKNETGQNVFVDFASVRKTCLVLRAINHKLRQQILHLLENESKLTVTDIYISLGIEQSVASQHLAILRRSKFVETIRQGKFIYYSLCYSKFTEISQVLNILV